MTSELDWYVREHAIGVFIISGSMRVRCSVGTAAGSKGKSCGKPDAFRVD